MLLAERDDLARVGDRGRGAGHALDVGALAASRDEILSPMTSIASGGGPIHATPGARDGPGEVGVLGEEPVTGMYAVSSTLVDRVEDRLGVEVALGRGLTAECVGLVGIANVQASRSSSEYTATLAMPSSRHVRMTRIAISPRFAIRIFESTAAYPKGDGVGAGRRSKCRIVEGWSLERW